MAEHDYELGRYGFERIDRSKLQSWAEAVSDDEALGVNEKAFALRLLGEFSDSVDAEHLSEEFREPMASDESIRRVSLGRLMDCDYVKIAWTRVEGNSTLFGIVLGMEVWKRDDEWEVS